MCFLAPESVQCRLKKVKQNILCRRDILFEYIVTIGNYGRFRIVAAGPITSLCLFACQSVLLSAFISAANTGRIYVKFGIGYFYQNLSINFKYG